MKRPHVPDLVQIVVAMTIGSGLPTNGQCGQNDAKRSWRWFPPHLCESVGKGEDRKFLNHLSQPPTVCQIAEACAPILSYSHDEPLLLYGYNIPCPLPPDLKSDCRDDSASAIVYYKILEYQPQSEHEPLPTGNYTLRYFFYYPEDLGLAGHREDIESIDMDISVRQGCFVDVQRAHGYAHGVRWYTNTLSITTDTQLPLAILVEEGKHASCPDRNRDGLYTPGYDVNVTPNDAWGVRDVTGSKVLTRYYRASHSKPRRPEDMVRPKYVSLLDTLILNATPWTMVKYRIVEDSLYIEEGASTDEGNSWIGGYSDLLKMPGYELCFVDPARYKSIQDEKLQNLMTKNEFYGAQEGWTSWLPTLLLLKPKLLGDLIYTPVVSYRHDVLHAREPSFRTGNGFVIHTSFEPPYWFPGWAILRIGWVGSWFTDLMYSPSASRTFDWYVALGRDYYFSNEKEWAWEFGARGRFRVLNATDLLGIRTGVRFNSIDFPRTARVVFELGSGVW